MRRAARTWRRRSARATRSARCTCWASRSARCWRWRWPPRAPTWWTAWCWPTRRPPSRARPGRAWGRCCRACRRCRPARPRRPARAAPPAPGVRLCAVVVRARAARALRARRPRPRAPSGAAARRRCTRRCRSRSRPRSATPSCWPRSAWTPPRRWRSRRAGQPPCRSATLRGARRLRARARAGLQAPEPHRITAGPAAQASAFGEGVAALLPQLQMLARVLPPPTLAWKLRLIEEGCACGPAQPAR